MYTTTWDKTDKKVIMFTSEELSEGFELPVGYDKTPPVFLVFTDTTGVFTTVGWRNAIHSYKGTGSIRCDICRTEDPPRHRLAQKSMIRGDGVFENRQLNNAHVATPQMVVCNDCAKELDEVMDELIEEHPTDAVVDQL